MGSAKIGKLLQSVLPPEFEQAKRRLPEIQRFLEQNLPEPVNQSVTLLTLSRDEIVIAANSPMVANYLRLHSSEIQQQLRETFKLEQAVRFRAVPDSLLKLETHIEIRKPRHVSEQSIDAIKKNAQWIEDEALQAALLSLAESLDSD